MQPHWDIFCRVIDNFGDIGVCWRLARQLAHEHGIAVRLWVDDPGILAMLHPGYDPGQDGLVVDGIEIRRWREPFPQTEIAEVVVEAFACELPESYLRAMGGRSPAPHWINLEYLSAEPWVEGCHGLASPHPSLPLVKHFFFPGFTPRTGGLLRESGLLARRDHFLSRRPAEDALQVSLFCYDHAPVAALLDAWESGSRPVRCFVPPGKPLSAVRRHWGENGPWRRGRLEIVPIPFVAQSDFDQLLWRCDLNFVRGEDSFVRAQWAAKPFVWHIYPQEEAAHLEKVEAFLRLYCEGMQPAAAAATAALFRAWNADGHGLPLAWEAFTGHVGEIAIHTRQWTERLANQQDLAAALVKFCQDQL